MQIHIVRFDKEDVVGKEQNSNSYSFDINDDNDEFPSLNKVLHHLLHIKSTLKEHANH
jgi:hypothetical protein